MAAEQEELIRVNAEAKQNFTLDSQIKDCDSNDLFLLLQNYFISLFRDIQELRKFIVFLKENKTEEIVNSVLQNFEEYLSEFRS